MADKSFVLSSCNKNLVPKNYLTIALDARKAREKCFSILLEQRKVPEIGWSDQTIEEFVNYLSSLDSNNFLNQYCLGEREARIACNLVAKRHYNFGHGIGRSGDLLEPQPKAAGSTILNNLTNCLLLDLIKTVGVRSTKKCFLVPMATGMTLTLCFLSLQKTRPKAKIVLWSRIDQKSCFKSMTTSGLKPIIIELKKNESGLHTNLEKFKETIENVGPENILLIYSTTSCFAPRNSDNIIELAKLSKKYDIPHVCNNAYGLQSTYLTHQIEEAHKNGRVDLFVQSTDKNLMVPVGGSILAGFDEDVMVNVARTYVGRASSSQSLDVLMTILSFGTQGIQNLISERKKNFIYLKQQLTSLAEMHNENVIQTMNPISLAFTLKSLIPLDNVTKLGSMLFVRSVSGVRIIDTNEIKIIDDYCFRGWGSHTDEASYPYLTVAAAIGVSESDINTFIKKLDSCLKKLKLKV